MDAELTLDRPAAKDAAPRLGGDPLLSATLRLAVARQLHRGSHALGMVEVASVLWSRFLRFDADDALWPDRDRFVVSTARFAPLLRALLGLLGEPAAREPEAEDRRRLLGFGQHPAVEMAIGPAGQGIATATGMAIAERILAERFGQSLVDHRSWVLACETDLAAGVALEAAALAGQMRLERLTVLFELDAGDPDQPASPAGDAPFGPMARFAACGWSVRRVDAQDPEAIAQAIASAMRGRRPSLIACVVKRQPEAEADAGPIQAEADAGPIQTEADAGQIQAETDPEVDQVPEQNAQEAWRACGKRGSTARRGWLKRLARHRQCRAFEQAIAGSLPTDWRRTWREAWQHFNDAAAAGEMPGPADPKDCGARRGLEALLTLLPEFVSLSCEPVRPGAPPPVSTSAGRIGRTLSLGTQEHGMAALLNGIALHGGLLACGSASFIAVDRMRPALRLGALMGRQVIHLLTHDGLALGEDGAAWQPVEQLASLRAMPNVAVFRPADGTEMMECWQLALHRGTGPSVIAFSSGVPPDLRERVRLPGAAVATPIGNACALGGYVLADPPEGRERDVTLIATGAEITLAVAARDRLMRLGIAAAVVSLPCWELFSAQTAAYREAILGAALRIGIEAASGFGWERWLGPDGVFIGIDDFGVSAPADELYRQFGLTPDAVAARVQRRLSLPLPPPKPQRRQGFDTDGLELESGL
jgi:transketolase